MEESFLKENLFRYICVVVFCFATIFLFSYFNVAKTSLKDSKNANLVIYGDNISTAYTPFIQDDGIYISVDTISKVIDSHIYYDKQATKVIITTEDTVLKFKIDENKAHRNFVEESISTPARFINDMAYIDINLVKDLYNIIVSYNEETSTISIDKTNDGNQVVKYNFTNVYEDLKTNSNVLKILNKGSKITVYTESLKHNRWYKIKTEDGIIGYISKNSVDVSNNSSDKISNSNNSENAEKINMFWQYGSELSTLGDKIEGVNVVSPTWYELKNAEGDISSKASSKYLEKAKQNGYEVWPIITNGIDDVNYTAADTSAMVNSEYNREQFIKNLVEILKKDKVDGINIDFEAMRTEDRDVFTQFVRELAPILRNAGLKVSADIYFVAYVDRKGVGEAVDYVMLMGYDQRGNWSSVAGSISEISWVEENIESLMNDSKIPANKIILGIPFYTRLWTQKAGATKPTTTVYTMANCQTFLKNNNLQATLDEASGQNYAEYTKGNTTYKLWIEDADSVKRRIETVNKYDLAGVCAWRKGLETQDIWKVINDTLKK